MTRVAKPGLPDLKVEIAPTATPFTASPTWVDITTDLRLTDSVTFNRGRTDARAQAQPGTLTITLNNSAGNYTPGLASGAYHPLSLRCPIRVSFKPPGAGAYTVMWTGLIDEYSPSWDKSRPTCTIRASDRLSQLNKVELQQWEATALLAQSPTVLFPLTEGAGSQTVGSVTATPHTLGALEFGVGGAYDLGSGSLPVDEGTVCAFTPADFTQGWCFKTAAPDGGAGASLYSTNEAIVSCLMNTTTIPTNDTSIFYATLANPGTEHPIVGLGVGVSASGHACSHQGLIGIGASTVGSKFICDGEWHHIAVHAHRSGSSLVLDTYVDGVLDSTMTIVLIDIWFISAYLTTVFDSYTIGGMRNTAQQAIGAYYSGQVSMCAAWNASSLDAAAIIAAGYGSLAGSSTEEVSTARFTRLCAAAGITGATIGTGSSTLGKQNVGGKTVLDALDDVATSEVSPVYVTGAGVPTLAARSARYGAAVAMTFTAKDVGADVAFILNDEGLINDAKGTRPGGAEQRITNTASIASYGARTSSEAYLVNTDAQLVNILQWLTNVYAEPAPRTAQLKVDGWTKQATVDLDDLLALEVGSRVQVTGLPSTAPATTLDLMVEGLTDTFNTTGWQRNLNTSAASAVVNVWVLDSATQSQLDSTTILAL